VVGDIRVVVCYLYSLEASIAGHYKAGTVKESAPERVTVSLRAARNHLEPGELNCNHQGDRDEREVVVVVVVVVDEDEDDDEEGNEDGYKAENEDEGEVEGETDDADDGDEEGYLLHPRPYVDSGQRRVAEMLERMDKASRGWHQLVRRSPVPEDSIDAVRLC
jgi:hypothetical protein